MGWEALERLRFASNSLRKMKTCEFVYMFPFLIYKEQSLRFSHIFWIDSSSEDAVDLSLKKIAKANNVEDPSASAALDWISGRSSWLMVFDNADGGYQVVEKFLPPGKSGNILITSRDKGLERVALDKNSLEVQQMEQQEPIIAD